MTRGKFPAVAILFLAVLACACGASRRVEAPAGTAAAARGPEVWENDIAEFIRLDAAAFPPENAILFLGSSSIRMWDLAGSFPGLKTINRGFGGSYISDVAHYADRIIFPYSPRLIVFYAGDNDIADNKPPAALEADFNEFLRKIRERLPLAPVIYISIKPSPARWALWPEMREANSRIEASCARRAGCRFLRVDAAMLGRDGLPDPALFLEDGLHLNEKGYSLWTSLLEPLLK